MSQNVDDAHYQVNEDLLIEKEKFDKQFPSGRILESTYVSKNQHILSFTERYVPTDVIMTVKGKSSILYIKIYEPEKHPSPLILSTLYRVDIHCYNGVIRSFGFHKAYIDSNLKVRVKGYSELFDEIKNWELAK